MKYVRNFDGRLLITVLKNCDGEAAKDFISIMCGDDLKQSKTPHKSNCEYA